MIADAVGPQAPGLATSWLHTLLALVAASGNRMRRRRLAPVTWLCIVMTRLATAGSQRVHACSSLDGPSCPVINHKEAKKPYESASLSRSSLREHLDDKVRRYLKANVKERKVLGGSFKISGSLPDAEGHFVLTPGAWLKQPSDWTTVGLRGQFEDNVTLSGFITHPMTGEVISLCTRFALQRRPLSEDDAPTDRMPDNRPPQPYSLVGTWQGVYVCADTVTRLILTLNADHAAFPSLVHGIFEFAVINDLTPFELNELTRLVSESLLDFGSDAHNK